MDIEDGIKVFVVISSKRAARTMPALWMRMSIRP